MASPLRLKIVTFGCKVNQYESQYLREGLQRSGYQEAGAEDVPNLIVVNSCAVTARSESKCRQLVRRLAKKHPRAEIVVTGCYAVRRPAEVAQLPGVTEVLSAKRQIPEFLARRGLQQIPDGISTFTGRSRAWVKVQDGCRQGCSYCIVPRVRPVLASRPLDEILAEVQRLVRSGIREIVLSGTHLGQYGVDRPETPLDLAALVRHVLTLGGEFRVRLSSIEAPEITSALLDLMRDRPERLCPHLHIPLQSGSDTVLKNMRRRWTIRQFIDRCHEIRELLHRPALTTDVMVGFPGETEADFQATGRAVEEVSFTRLHVFRFSPREGTPAATMPRRVPQRVHQHHANQLIHLGQMLQVRYLTSLQKTSLQVLIEGSVDGRPGLIYGTAERYVTVVLPGSKRLEGRIIPVMADTVEGERLFGLPMRSLTPSR